MTVSRPPWPTLPVSASSVKYAHHGSSLDTDAGSVSHGGLVPEVPSPREHQQSPDASRRFNTLPETTRKTPGNVLAGRFSCVLIISHRFARLTEY